MSRDLDKNPYSLEEGRVCDYLQKLAPDIGCGDDPIGFLIANHAAISIDLQTAQETGRNIGLEEAALLCEINGEVNGAEEIRRLKQ